MSAETLQQRYDKAVDTLEAKGWKRLGPTEELRKGDVEATLPLHHLLMACYDGTPIRTVWLRRVRKRKA